MLGLILMSRRLAHAVHTAWSDRAFRGVAFSLVILLIAATIFYTTVEGWSVLDSVYFAVVTGLTIGYGDLTPASATAKVFTIVYSLLAVGLFVALATGLANAHLKNSRRKHKAHRHGDNNSDTVGEHD